MEDDAPRDLLRRRKMQRRAGGQHGFVFAFCRDKQRRGSVCATDDADNGSVLRFGHERVVLGRFALNRRIVLRAVLNGDEVFRRGRRERIGHCGKSIRKIETRVGKSVFRQRLRLQILSRQRVRYAVMGKRKYVAGLLNFKLRAGHAHGLRGQRQRERRNAFRAALRLPRERIAVDRPAVFRG